MNEIMLFEPVMQQSYLQNQFDLKFHVIDTITPGSKSTSFYKMRQSYISI